jgi:YfiH family protein
MRLTLPLARAARRGWVLVPFPVPVVLTLAGAGSMDYGSPERETLLAELDSDVPVCTLEQVHSRHVVVVDPGLRDNPSGREIRLGRGDGMVTGERGPALGVTVADCWPVFLFDRGSRAFGVVHSGWRGTGILRVAVETMVQEYGTSPSDLVVTMGPGISVESYCVDEERAHRFALSFGESAVVERDGAWHLDLAEANIRLARELGIEDVSIVDHDTFLTNELGSYRREGPEEFTRTLAMIGPVGRNVTGCNGKE